MMMLSAGFCNAQTNPVKIGWIKEGLSQNEVEAVDSYLSKQKFLTFIAVSPKELSDEFLKKNHLKQLWWFKDSEPITVEEQKSGEVLKHFVRDGGQLLLSMEAVRFLNIWGIEKNQLDIREDTVTDEGFGRPRGFHGYHSHPIFQGLHGGAYTWKGKTDHVARIIGFFDQHLPDTNLAKVIGIGWSYITFHEDQKLIMEYHFGKGSVIAVGAYTYFSRPNFNTFELYRFYNNVFNYQAGRITGIKADYWSYRKPQVIIGYKKLPVIPLAPATSWPVPGLSLELKRSKATHNFVDVAGKRMLLMGKEQAGIDEIWAHPFMAFRDIQTGLQMKGSDSITWLNQLPSEISVSPEMLRRKYALGHDTLSEVITVDFDKPVGVLHYQWSGNRFNKIWIRYTSNLRDMWPYSDTSSPEIHYQWSDGMNASLVSNAHAGSLSIFGFSNRPWGHLEGQYKDFHIKGAEIGGIHTDLRQVSGVFGFDATRLKGKLNVYLLASNEGIDKAIGLYCQVTPELNTLYQRSTAYYRKLLNTQLMITTPDVKFNQGYRWAMVRSDQFLQTTPGEGTSMMAGFGTTARGWNGRQTVSGRPGYAWYFGRDGEWSAMALDAMGGFEKVGKVLAMFAKYQAVNGKIFHELTSSGAVHYDAADATPLFVELAYHYLRYSGDTAYIRQLWPSIKKAMDFCYSTDTDHDGLIENTNVGHGWIEGGPLFGAHTEFYLAGCWAAALDASGFMAGKLHLPALEKKYYGDARKVKMIIDSEFWSEKQRSFFNGKMADGTYMKDATVLAAVPIWLNTVTDVKKASETTDSFAAANFSTDWGMRIIPDDNPHYNPYAYHAGMVWPLFTGYASLAEYKTGHFTSGFTHLMSNLLQYSNWALGSVAETMSGDVYQSAGVCSLQAWSETMVIQPAIEGMLGFFPDATIKSLSLTPSFPWDWAWVNINQMRVGNTVVNMKFRKSNGKAIYDFNIIKGSSLHLNLNPIFPPGTQLHEIWVDNKEIHFTHTDENEGVKASLPELTIKKGMKITIFYSGGTGVLPLVNEPIPGSGNTGAKILHQVWKEGSGLITLEGIPGKTYQFEVFSIPAPRRILNGHFTKDSAGNYLITTKIPEGKNKFDTCNVTLYY